MGCIQVIGNSGNCPVATRCQSGLYLFSIRPLPSLLSSLPQPPSQLQSSFTFSKMFVSIFADLLFFVFFPFPHKVVLCCLSEAYDQNYAMLDLATLRTLIYKWNHPINFWSDSESWCDHGFFFLWKVHGYVIATRLCINEKWLIWSFLFWFFLFNS